jgi:transcriptional regulator of acetoin/glycerol metabolism
MSEALSIEIPADATYEKALDVARAAIVRAALARSPGPSAAARQLGISREGLHKIRLRLGIYETAERE